MRAAEVSAFLAELAALGVRVEPDGPDALKVSVPRSAVSPAEVARRVRSAKPALLAHFNRERNARAGGTPDGVRSSPRRTGLPEWPGDPALYGADALPRRHAPPPEQAPQGRPHASAVKVCGGCSRWSPTHPGAEGGSCSAGWKAHGLAPIPGMDLPETSRGSRCWAWAGQGWRRAVPA